MTGVKGPGVEQLPGAVAVEPAGRRVRVMAAATWVGDSNGAVLLFEQGLTPRWYLPLSDVRTDLLRLNARTTETVGRGRARWYDLTVSGHTIHNAAWDHPETPLTCPDLQGLISFEWNLMDAWFEEDDQAVVHPRDPYTRVDVLASSRHVTIDVGGVNLADTVRPMLLFETGLPTRYYVNPLDVRRDLLVPSESFTWCPYKGRAGYWHVQIGDTLHRDLLWSYAEPFTAAQRVIHHFCAFNEFVDIRVDGQPVERPDTKWAHGGPNATSFRPGDERWDPTSTERSWDGNDPGENR